MKDISGWITIEKQGDNRLLRPFVYFRTGSGHIGILWLEYCTSAEPDDAALHARPTPSKAQTTRDFRSLPERKVYLSQRELITHDAVCQRIIGWEIAGVKLDSGCLWTLMQP